MLSKVNNIPPRPEKITYFRLKRHEIYCKLRDVKKVVVNGKLVVLNEGEGDLSY